MFSKHEWPLTPETAHYLGESQALARALTDAPLTPEVYDVLMNKSLKQGALATTAIEGNSITEEEYDKYIAARKDMPPSRQYQQREVENILTAFDEVLKMDLNRPLDCDLIRRFHELVMANMPEAQPGRFRDCRVTVGGYRPPDHMEVPVLMSNYCAWLERFKITPDFIFARTMPVVLAAHAFFELIHPFQDGNGRTGRLIEYYLLLQAGVPRIAGHALSNFYNNNRTAYTLGLSKINYERPDSGLIGFINYAAVGLRDELQSGLEAVQAEQRRVFWRHLVYDRFDRQGGGLPKTTKERRRTVALNFPLDKTLALGEIPINTQVFEYGGLDQSVLKDDADYLIQLRLLEKDGERYSTDYSQVCPGCGEAYQGGLKNDL